MGAVVPTEISYSDIPGTVQTGTSSRRVFVHLRYTTLLGGGSTINLATYIPGLADIEGIVYETDANVAEGTASTWSTSTLTISTGVAGAYEAGFICTLT